MISEEAKVHIIDTINGDMNKEYFINEILPKIEKDLELLEILKKYIYYSEKSHRIRMREKRDEIYIQLNELGYYD